MKRVLLAAAAAAAMLFGSTAADAKASAVITYDGMHVMEISSGATSSDESFSAMLAPLASQTFTVHYSIDLSAAGMTATRDWSYCTPVLDTYCGPSATGNELAEAILYFTADSRSDMNDSINFNFGSPVLLDEADGFDHLQGTMTLTATNIDSTASHLASASLIVGAFVDANPIPEPGTAALMLAGLAILAAPRRRRASR